MKKRGIIVSPFEITDLNSVSYNSITGNKLKYYLLYWDKISITTNSIVFTDYSDDIDMRYLIDNKLLSVEHTNLSTLSTLSTFNGAFSSAISISQIDIFNKLSQDMDCQWTLGQIGTNFCFPKIQKIANESIIMELYNAVLVPSDDISFDDILDFKEKRKDELMNFRHSIESLYMQIISSGDIPRAKNIVIEKLERSILDLKKVSEKSLKSILSTIKIKINPLTFSSVFTSNYLATKSVSIALMCSFASTLYFEGDKNFFNIPSNLRDYAYLYNVKANLS